MKNILTSIITLSLLSSLPFFNYAKHKKPKNLKYDNFLEQSDDQLEDIEQIEETTKPAKTHKEIAANLRQKIRNKERKLKEISKEIRTLKIQWAKESAQADNDKKDAIQMKYDDTHNAKNSSHKHKVHNSPEVNF